MNEEKMRKVLREVASCAARWEYGARLVGNVQAGDILCACALALDTISALRDEIHDERATPTEGE